MKKVLLFCLAVVMIPSTAFAIKPYREASAVLPSAHLQQVVNRSEAESDHLDLLNHLLFRARSRDEAELVLTEIEESGDTFFVGALIDILRYRRDVGGRIGQVLNQLTGADLPPGWHEWAEWYGRHPEIKSFPEYPTWKSRIFSAIDPNFLRFVHADVKVDPDSRVEEITWGGVRVDGIPALDNPKMIDADEADYLVPHERVFGVSINGDTRAYPARFLDWHEMFNDIVGGEPVALAY